MKTRYTLAEAADLARRDGKASEFMTAYSANRRHGMSVAGAADEALAQLGITAGVTAATAMEGVLGRLAVTVELREVAR